MYLPHWPIPSTLGAKEIDYETVFERAQIVLERLGNPHLKLPPIIHVAGTNGKGSTASFLDHIFRYSGYKSHLYTSPHLHDCNERILLNGEKISDSFLHESMEETRIAAEGVDLTFMEGFTIGAFLAFSKVPADVLILECGMGGRIDITNIFEKKLATIITPISYDHTEYLGNSIERIALEKAMIMRPNTPLIIGPQANKALEVIEILAQDQNLESCVYNRDFYIEKDEETGEFDFNYQSFVLKDLPKPSLAGEHQYVNFSVALATIFSIKEQFQTSENDIRKAIKTHKWASRLERIHGKLEKILTDQNSNSEIWIDGAHNVSGAFALARWLEKVKFKNYVICGFSRNKCKAEFLKQFENIAEIIAVRVDGEPYPESAERIVEIGESAGIKIHEAEDLMDAIHYISQKNQTSRIVICGSLHLARDVKKFNQNDF